MQKRPPIKTQLQLERLRARSASYDVPVAIAPGMIVRVSPKGKKSYRWDRGRGHKPRVVTYGHYPSMSLREAADNHAKTRQSHEDGIGVAPRGALPTTVAELAESFYGNRIKPHRGKPEYVRRTLDKDILPRIGRLKLRSVTPPVVGSIVQNIIGRGSPAQSSKVLAIAKQMFNYGVAIGAMDHNPATTLTPVNFGIVENAKSRILTGPEIRDLHIALDQHLRLSRQIRAGLKILLLTGLRSGELRQTAWENVDLERGTLTVPVKLQKISPRQAKTAVPFVCPLSHQSVALIKGLKGLDSTWLLPGRPDVNGEVKPLSEKALGRAVRRLITPSKPGEQPFLQVNAFAPHNLRRTVRSGLSQLGVAPHISERVLNHSLGKIIDVYDHHDYLEERRDALQSWADHIDTLLAASNVYELRSGTG